MIFWVCKNCGSQNPWKEICWRCGKAKAIEAWNRRVEDVADK